MVGCSKAILNTTCKVIQLAVIPMYSHTRKGIAEHS